MSNTKDLIGMDDILNANWDEFEKKAQDEKKGGGAFSKDDTRIWKPDYSKSGIYYFYFLPDMKSNLPTNIFNTHSIKLFDNGKKMNIYGVCPKTVGKECPICEYGWGLYNMEGSTKSDKDQARNFLPQKNEYVNILVVKDPSNQDNEGKVFLYKLPVSIKKLVAERLSPSDKNLADDEFVAFNPFKPTATSKFKLDVETNPSDRSRCNYDKSKFVARSKKELGMITKDKEELVKIINSCYNLKEAVDEYVEKRVISEEKYAKESILGKIISGSSMIQSPPTDYVEPKTHVIDEDNGDDGISDEEKEFMKEFG